MNRTACWSSLPLLALSLSSLAADTNAERAALDRDLPALMQEHRIPSVSVAHVKNGRLAFAAAYGMQSDGVPATTNTLYNIASLTKPVSAETVLRLASAGTFTLDDPLDAFWSDPDLAGDERRHLLTPRINLSHQTGLPNWRRKQPLAFSFTPGTSTGYSGEGYEYVARYAEKKSGKGFEQLADELVFKPLAMRDTAYTDRPWFAGRVATPTNAEGKAIESGAHTTYFASDLIHTTPSDYAKFVISVMKNEGVTKAIAAERGRIQRSTKAQSCEKEKVRAACPDDVGFGLGWEVDRFGDKTILMHGGRDDGASTWVYAEPASGNAIIILTNSDNGAMVFLPILERLGADPRLVNYMQSQM
ncbi:MAG TPA: serine hydrolase domain-containing protein [Tahibacter sp.]|nr:serine hydrolase domain-containing protein [Tahibacter sp.]